MSAIDLPVIDFINRQRDPTRFIDNVVAGIEGSSDTRRVGSYASRKTDKPP